MPINHNPTSDMLPAPILPNALCNCLALRQAARRVTQHYDRALAPSGLKTTQFSVLAMLRRYQPIGLGALAAHLVMDRATLGHNLRPLQKAGWVTLAAGMDRRRKMLALTETGSFVLADAGPLWRQAQDWFEACFGPRAASTLRADLAIISQMKPGANIISNSVPE